MNRARNKLKYIHERIAARGGGSGGLSYPRRRYTTPVCLLITTRQAGASRARHLRCHSVHAKNKIAGRFILFLVLGFWDKNTGICAGAVQYRRDFPATTRI